MSTAPENQTRAGNIPALERATGRSWAEWISYFEANAAASLPHSEIARLAQEAMPATLENPDWWAQGAAIAFEQHAGLRVPGQSSTGSFRVSVSRTLPFDRDTAVEAWAAGPGSATEHLGHTASSPRRTRTDKRTFWRTDLTGAGRVEFAASPHPKDADRSAVTIAHDGLPTAEEIERWRAHWKALLAALSNQGT